MKKRVFKIKKETTVHKFRKKIRHVTAAAAAALLALGLGIYANGETAYAQQEFETVITEIRHQHIGNATQEGGCYLTGIPHVHQGNEEEGGSCYQTPVYHTHQGNPTQEQGCYQTPVYHVHEGNETEGGGCYEPVYHVHEKSCTGIDDCYIHFEYVEVASTNIDTCPAHGEREFVTVDVIATHTACGRGVEPAQLNYCPLCSLITPILHPFFPNLCGMDEATVTGYTLSCQKTEETIEEYQESCNKAEGEIERYEQSCLLTVDGYGLSCGHSEGELCGRLIVTGAVQDGAETARLCVELEDLTGGKLKLKGETFVWYDETGTSIGEGGQVEILKNGEYFVVAELENEDVDNSRLESRIEVENLVKKEKAEDPQQESSVSPETSENSGNENSSEPTAMPTHILQTEDAPQQTESTRTQESSATPGSTPKQEGIQTVMEEAPASGENGIRTDAGGREEHRQETASPSALPVTAPFIPQEEESVGAEEAMEEIVYEVQGVNRERSFFDKPVVRALTITLSSALLLAGGGFFLCFLKKSVGLYNDDGEGGLVYLGRCPVQWEEETDFIIISPKMIERSVTNRYAIRPGLYLAGKSEEEELLVCKEEKKIAVYLAREMIVII